MKVQLIVVQGKPEGKVIPLVGPTFKIGRGETCHLRPNSEQVSREHAEFTVSASQVVVKDLGSRNGTLVNGKALTGPYTLKDRDLVQIGQLTFAISIENPPAAVATAPAAVGPSKATAKPASPDDVSQNEIDSWLIADEANQPPERPSGVYGGETMTIEAFKDSGTSKPKAPAPAAPVPPPAAAAQPAPAAPKPAPAAARPAPAAPKPAPTPPPPPPSTNLEDQEYERLPEGEGDVEELAENDEGDDDDNASESPEEFIDESNPFYVKKTKESESPAKKAYTDTSDAASDILRRLMDKRRSSR